MARSDVIDCVVSYLRRQKYESVAAQMNRVGRWLVAGESAGAVEVLLDYSFQKTVTGRQEVEGSEILSVGL